ncbi:hypothetical protein GCM10022419_013610 [Nonomuraea rosea]|uniref:HTH tetR-type domain-containing protein n=1 Tax=Nonomuraea rosea TaxID=638574 RepID=A0ABP6VK55_9ACTN
MQAARELFTTRGHARVTMSDIARMAGTASTETLEKLRDATSLESAVALVARGTRADHERSQPMVDLLYSSMAGDDGARETWQHVLTGCRQALRDAAELIVGKGFIAPHFHVENVADRLWFCFGLNAWRTLIVDCQWACDDAERTLNHQATSMLTES